MKKILLIGSGLASKEVPNWNIPDDWIICCIHNAWMMVPRRFNILLHARDFPEERKPISLESYQRLQMTYYYVNDSFNNDIHGGFWRNHCGYGKTMFFSSFWWIIENLDPKLIGFIGCDMNYPEKGDNTIYGRGSPDPLKYPHKSLLHWLGFLDGYCVRANITLINYSPYESPTLLPFAHGIFPEEKPIERPREHRTKTEYFVA